MNCRTFSPNLRTRGKRSHLHHYHHYHHKAVESPKKKQKNKPYTDRLRHFRLPTLEHRRRSGGLIHAYKYISGIHHVKNPQFTMTAYSLTRGNSQTILSTVARRGLTSSFCYERVVAD